MTDSRDNIDLLRERQKMLADCPQFAPFFPDKTEADYIKISDVKVWDENRNVKYIFESAAIIVGGESIIFVSLSPKEFELKRSEIKLSEKAPYDLSSTYYLVDEIQIDENNYKGQWLQEDMESGIIQFKKNEDGLLSSFNRKDISFVKHSCNTPDANLWELIPYLDHVFLKDGRKYDGFIESIVYTKGLVKFLTVDSESGDAKSFKFDEIIRYTKTPNPRCKKSVPKVAEEPKSDLYINGLTSQLSGISNVNGHYVVSTSADAIQNIVYAGSRVVLKIKTDSRTSKVMLAKAKLKKEKNFGVSGVQVRNKGTDLWPIFRTEDFFLHPDINFRCNDGTYMEADLAFKDPGVYVFWISGSPKCVAINVK